MSEKPPRQNRHARRTAKSQTKTIAVSTSTLEILKDLKEGADLAQAEAQSLSSKFQLAIAKEFRKLKMPIQDSAICLNCGTVRSRNIQDCLVCKPPEPPGSMQDAG